MSVTIPVAIQPLMRTDRSRTQSFGFNPSRRRSRSCIRDEIGEREAPAPDGRARNCIVADSVVTPTALPHSDGGATGSGIRP